MVIPSFETNVERVKNNAKRFLKLKYKITTGDMVIFRMPSVDSENPTSSKHSLMKPQR